MLLTDNRFLDSARERLLVLADLHANSAQYSIAAEEAGTDAVVLHLNQDAPGGARFGGMDLEEDSIKDALSVIKIPAGISIGDGRALLATDWDRILDLGFSFVNMYAHHMPSFVWSDSRISKAVSIGPGYILEQVRALSEFPETSVLVAALTPTQGIGLPLTLFDIATISLITKLSSKPVLVPTQRSITMNDLGLLKNLGCRGLLISNVIYGESVDSCKDTFARYRESLIMPQVSTAEEESFIRQREKPEVSAD